MPAALMTGHHLLISALWNASSACGAICSREDVLRKIDELLLDPRIGERLAAASSFAMTGCGVPLGAQSACQNEK
jgi:hypothetical protein